MKIYLIRHAQAIPEHENPQKPLSETGKKQAKKVATFLRHLDLTITNIVHSPKARSKETAEIISASVVVKKGLLESPNLKPNDPVPLIKEECVKKNVDLMFVGHLPFMDYLLSSLVCNTEAEKIVTFYEATTVCLEKQGADTFTIDWVVHPKMLPDLS